MIQLADVPLLTKVLIRHMDNHIDQALEIAINVFRFPAKYLRIVEARDVPARLLILESPGALLMLLDVELKPNEIDPNTVDTWINGEFADLITYNKIATGGSLKGGNGGANKRYNNVSAV